MATVNMQDKIAIMAQADVAVTINGQVFTMPATTPFTTQRAEIDIPAATVLAVMYNTESNKGEIVQVFSIDEIITVT